MTTFQHHAYRLLLRWSRTLHVYLTLLGLTLLLFFAVTGFMLNHENWFLPRQSTTGAIPLELLGLPEDRDGILARLRDDFGVPGELEAYDATADSLRITFKSDEGRAFVDIRKRDGVATVTHDTDRSREIIAIVEGTMPVELLRPDDPSVQLPIVEMLRKKFAARGEVNSPPTYEKEDESFHVVFKSPGYLGTAVIRAGDGHTRVIHQSRGINGILLDLHRGKDSGLAWSLVIDGVAILFVIVAVTGFILWTSLRSRAQNGFVILMAGAAIGLAIYFVCVPR